MTDQLPTTERLARALEAADDPVLAHMIVRARAGYYDDYKSTIAWPISELIHDLEQAGHPELAQRARDGEFDGTRQEAEEWWNREGPRLFPRRGK